MPVPVRSFVRAYNRYNILNTIRVSGMISRIDISKTTGLSRASVTGITADLIKEGLILEKQTGEYAGGRRPILLAINPEGAHVLGVNIELYAISVVIINFQADIKASYSLPLERGLYKPEELVEKITQAIQACMWESSYSKEQISGIGIGVPGLVDSQSGMIRFMPNYGWRDVDLRGLLRKRINHNIFIDNDTNNLTIAEHWYGNSTGSDNFIVVSVENGVGAGCVVNGHLMRGNLGMAGELGHLIIDPDGPLCKCGKRGCISAYSGIDAVLRDAGKIKANISFEDVLMLIKEGNPETKKIYEKAGWALGVGISHLVKLLNPQKIIVTGRGVQAGDILFNPMFESIKESQPDTFGSYKNLIKIKIWNEEDWAKGAGALALQEIYESPAGK